MAVFVVNFTSFSVDLRPTSAKSVFHLAEDNSLRKHLKALRFKLKCKKMYNKILRWLKENRKSFPLGITFWRLFGCVCGQFYLF